MPNPNTPHNHTVACGTACHKPAAPPHETLTTQVKEFFTGLFDTANWPPRWHCGSWTDFHGWLYIVSDLMIWAAYFAIPILLYRIVSKRKDLPFLKLFWLFIAFILLCGSTHLLDAIIFWWPAYRLSALIRFVTGIVSISTVFILHRTWPMINNLRTLTQLEAEIEERKKAEAEARQHQIQKESAQELALRKEEFMSVASHELKTPITSVKASLQLIERMVALEEKLQSVEPLVKRASRQVDKLTGIVKDLLDVTRIQEGKLELFRSEFVLADLIAENIEQCQPTESKHEITVSGDAQLTVFADRNRLDQVLCNLLTNAIKYSPDANRIDIRFEALPDGGLRLAIADYGIGIPEDQIQNVFDRFFRIEHTSQNFSGLGLGLFISSEIIKRHGGQMGVESELGKGSTFWFILPRLS
ncbi:sensor histidine kinase [Mucilaginibacter auburnensis]|uniref:histidine kinase n=1 Tax=Mucilaginibacter auburnensis TaxID=1457233 RepID=A0A2H9VQ03_9SPHI|nr:HAMP domain-containing sensor histidine kinase [Mucilaginibacter auburnensis]PJJ80413.1 signal transduction histidine kinase [Mucilaginibacter auburnensis]